GFTALKITPQPDNYKTLAPAETLRESVERVRQVREAVGPNIDICLDFHGRCLSPVDAIWLAREIEVYRPLFLEEPALTEYPDSLREVKDKTIIPIAGGERCISRDRLREILETRCLHILQPEPAANGGILENIKWAAMAEMYHVMLAPHQACGPVSLLACAHIDACAPNFLIQECNVDLESPFLHEIYHNLPVIEEGYLRLPETAGIGIELNEEAADRYPWKPFDRPVIVQADGGIGME
ncbi:MAG: enolase C-terminal domain-like protein, partial [Bryobacteraceae bacterium]